MRFDDSLNTVLAADASSAFGAASAWRQIVDLIGRGRAPATPQALERLRAIRSRVPDATRAASARALAFAEPGAELVALFAEEDLAIAAPVLRTASLPAPAWVALLPALTPSARAVLRHRRDLPEEVTRALESFGPTDFVLAHAGADPVVSARPEPLRPEPVFPEPLLAPAMAAVEPTAGPFASLGAIARALPVVSEAMRAAPAAAAAAAEDGEDPSPIADLVARIDAFNRRRETEPDLAAATAVRAFRFETDAGGTIRWVADAPRGGVVGASIAGSSGEVDGVVAGAFRRRTGFRDARLLLEGDAPTAGSWRVSGTPLFDPATGRFTGYRGDARRPRADESAAPRSAAADSLRGLVHELRTPTNAIAGFAELIEGEFLGAVPAPYLARARAIRGQAAGLVDAIDDLDTAARLEGGALDLRTRTVPLAPLLARAVADLMPLARLRDAALVAAPVPMGMSLAADERAAERLVARLLAALLASASPGERLHVAAMTDGPDRVLLVVDRPRALTVAGVGDLLAIDAESEAEAPGAPLLGTGFALRLSRNLAAEMGGKLTIERTRLTLALPASVPARMGHLSFR